MYLYARTWYTYALAFVWRCDDNFQESLFSFYDVAPAGWTQVTTLGNKYFYPLSHLPSLPMPLMTPMPSTYESEHVHMSSGSPSSQYSALNLSHPCCTNGKTSFSLHGHSISHTAFSLPIPLMTDCWMA